MGLEGNIWNGKSIDGDWIKKHEVDEIDYDKEEKDSKDSFDYLFTEDELEEMRLEIEKEDEQKRSTKMLEESEMNDDEMRTLWGAEELGKSTINTPSTHKLEESISSRGMEIYDEKEFEQALEDFNKTVNDGDPIKEETNAEINRIMQQMELDW